jgi:hypothetical protein
MGSGWEWVAALLGWHRHPLKFGGINRRERLNDWVSGDEEIRKNRPRLAMNPNSNDVPPCGCGSKTFGFNSSYPALFG